MVIASEKNRNYCNIRVLQGNFLFKIVKERSFKYYEYCDGNSV